jgi:hypothetical protein
MQPSHPLTPTSRTAQRPLAAIEYQDLPADFQTFKNSVLLHAKNAKTVGLDLAECQAVIIDSSDIQTFLYEARGQELLTFIAYLTMPSSADMADNLNKSNQVQQNINTYFAHQSKALINLYESLATTSTQKRLVEKCFDCFEQQIDPLKWANMFLTICKTSASFLTPTSDVNQLKANMQKALYPMLKYAEDLIDYLLDTLALSTDALIAWPEKTRQVLSSEARRAYKIRSAERKPL